MIIRGIALASALAIPAFAQSDSAWTIGGSVGAEFGYHSVLTEKNKSGKIDVNGNDSIQPGQKYRNYFQVPGFYGTWNAFLQMESPTGQKFEFAVDASHDTWNHFDLKYVQAMYEDKFQKLILGDMYVTGGDLYLSSVDIFGISYDMNLLFDQKPLVMLSVFGGENRAPNLPYEKDPNQYNRYIGLDEVEAQKIVVGGKVLWNASDNFNVAVGFIGSKDYLENPIIRDGTARDVNLADPMFSSRTLFGDLNGKVLGGRGTFNLQLGFGGADTANVVVHRAVNEVFENAGLDVSTFAQLRRLMNNSSQVQHMNRDELELIFGDNTDMSVSEMRSELERILKLASEALKKHRDSEKDDPTEWTAQNLALSGSYNWKGQLMTVDAYFRFVGRNYYSAGSSDLLQNSRLLGAKLEAKPVNSWVMNVGYELNIENASGSGDAYNVFGFAEGSKLGLLPGADDNWLKKHEQDDLRTLYEHDFDFKNTIQVHDSIELVFGYALNYRTRNTPLRLHGNFFASSGIYSDSWFARQKGKPSVDLESDDGTISIDSARWAMYSALQDEKYLATQFEERLLKHTFELEATFRLPKNVLKIGGIWAFRTDLSKFNEDDLLDDFDFSNRTYGILGYQFHGSDYFEMRYPISLTTSLKRWQNTFSVTPRYRSYSRNDMSEFEWNLMESAVFHLNPGFLDLLLHGNIRQNFMSRNDDDESVDEMELDLDVSAGLKFQFTEKFGTEWTFGAFFNNRPDNKSEDYSDIYGMVSVTYDF